jgi:hypothetical protein
MELPSRSDVLDSDAVNSARFRRRHTEEASMHGIIYLIGLIVVIMAILSFFGLR